MLPADRLRLRNALDSRESLGFQAVEFFDEGAGHGVAEACVEVDLPKPVHTGFVQLVCRPTGVLFRGLLGLADDPYIFEGGRDLLVPAVQAGVGDFDRAHYYGLAATIGDELSGVEEDQVGTSDEQPHNDYARRVEARHAAHEGSRGRGYGPSGLSEPLCHETEDLAALQVIRRPVLPGRRVEARGGIEGRPAVSGKVDLYPGVGVRGANIIVAGERVVLARGVARRHPGRYPQGAGHHGERGTELLAVAALLLEEEVLDGVHLSILGRDGEVVRICLLEVLVHLQHGPVRVGGTLGQPAGERAGTFEAGGGELRVPVRYLFGIDSACEPELVGGSVRDAGDDRVRRALGDLVGRPQGGIRVDLDGARREEYG